MIADFYNLCQLIHQNILYNCNSRKELIHEWLENQVKYSLVFQTQHQVSHTHTSTAPYDSHSYIPHKY